MINIFEEMVKAEKSLKAYAIVTVIKNEVGGTAEPGKKMIQYADGTIQGTIGGGEFEFECMKTIEGIIAKGKSIQTINVRGVELLVEVFAPATTIVVVGGGHVGNALLKVAKLFPFATILIDDREEGMIRESIELADVYIKCTDYEDAILSEAVPEGAYFFCGAWSHDYDALAVKGALAKKPAYVGMVGSHAKVEKIFTYLANHGVSKEALDTVYAPIGLDIADGSPIEIAFAIIAEMLMVKNDGEGIGCKGVKTKFLTSSCQSIHDPIGDKISK